MKYCVWKGKKIIKEQERILQSWERARQADKSETERDKKKSIIKKI